MARPTGFYVGPVGADGGWAKLADLARQSIFSARWLDPGIIVAVLAVDPRRNGGVLVDIVLASADPAKYF